MTKNFLDDVQDWCNVQFAAADYDARVAKVREEFAELEATGFSDTVEMADLVITLLHLANGQGQYLSGAIIDKHAVNQRRAWVQSDDGSFSHVRV